MKRAASAIVLSVVIAGARIAHAGHPGDIISELSLWQFLAVGTLVLLGFFAATAIKKLLGRRHKTAQHGREHERA